MRELRYVGPGSNPGHVVVETADGTEQFTLPISAALHDATQTDLLGEPAPSVGPSADSDAPAPRRELSPRDIQVRVRAGESAESLAADTGADLQRIMRFAGPVLEERLRLTDEARRGRVRRTGSDGQTVVFGTTVDGRFAAHDVDPTAVRWDARRHGDGQWVVSAHWADGETERHAEWGFNLTTRTATPLDDAAAELLSDRPIRLVPAEPSTRPTLTVAPPLEPDSVDPPVDFPGTPDGYTGPQSGREDVFDQEAFDDDESEQGTEELPLKLASPAAHTEDDTLPQRTAGRRGRTQKPTMPSWDDILMGVRRKTD